MSEYTFPVLDFNVAFFLERSIFDPFTEFLYYNKEKVRSLIKYCRIRKKVGNLESQLATCTCWTRNKISQILYTLGETPLYILKSRRFYANCFSFLIWYCKWKEKGSLFKLQISGGSLLKSLFCKLYCWKV